MQTSTIKQDMKDVVEELACNNPQWGFLLIATEPLTQNETNVHMYSTNLTEVSVKSLTRQISEGLDVIKSKSSLN